jgi:hypothetical protein
VGQEEAYAHFVDKELYIRMMKYPAKFKVLVQMTTQGVIHGNEHDLQHGWITSFPDTMDQTTVHRSQVDPCKEYESCGNARFRERK